MRINVKALLSKSLGFMRIKRVYLKCLKDNWQTSIALLITHNHPGEIKSRLVFVLITCDFMSDIFLIPPERLRFRRKSSQRRTQ